MPFSPLVALITASANLYAVSDGSHDCHRARPDLKPARAMDRVADPAPSLALTTSSPPNWTPEDCQQLDVPSVDCSGGYARLTRAS